MMRKPALFLALLLNGAVLVCGASPSAEKLGWHARAALAGKNIARILWRYYDLLLAAVVHPKKVITTIEYAYPKMEKTQSRSQSTDIEQMLGQIKLSLGKQENSVNSGQESEPFQVDPAKMITDWGYKILDADPTRRIWQVENPEIKEKFACGAYTIYNALTLEQKLGIKNIGNEIALLKDSFKKQGLSIDKMILNSDLGKLALDLKLQSIYPLELTGVSHMKIKILKSMEYSWCKSAVLNDPEIINYKVTDDIIAVDMRGPCDWNKARIKEYVDRWVTKKLNEVLSNLSKIKSDKIEVIHFACTVPEHVFLVSVIQLPQEKPFIFIVDNLDERMSSNLLTNTYTYQIADLFGI